jgi:hypothetical protein
LESYNGLRESVIDFDDDFEGFDIGDAELDVN